MSVCPVHCTYLVHAHEHDAVGDLAAYALEGQKLVADLVERQ
jgi:hypothetical protein